MQNNEILTGNILKTTLKFAIPLMFSAVFQMLFNTVDTIIVGKYAGDTCLAAVGSTSSLITLTIQLFMGLSIGVNIVISQYIGRNAKENIKNAISTTIILGAIGGCLVSLFGIIFSKQLLLMTQTPDNVIDLSDLYVRIYFLAMPAIMLYNYCAAILRAKGDTKSPLKYLTVSGIINFVLNVLFVAFFKMHVIGVGIASVIAQYISAIMAIRKVTNGESDIKLNNLKFDFSEAIKIIKIGLPAGLQGIVLCLSSVVLQTSINSLGKIVMAGDSAAYSLEGFVYAAMNSFYHTTLTFVAQNYGSSNKKRILKIIAVNLACATVTGGVLGYLTWFLGDKLLYLYTDNPDVVACGLIHLKWISKIYFLCGIMEVTCGALRGIGKSLEPTIIAIIVCCGLRIVWIVYVFPLYPVQDTIHITYCLTWIIATICYSIAFYIHYSKLDECA